MQLKHYLTAAALAAATFGATGAMAQDTVESESETGFYLGASGALASVQDTDLGFYDRGGTFGGTGTTDRADGRARLKNSAQVAATIGYDFGMIRTDVEVAYSRNRISAIAIDRLNGAAVTLTAADAADVCDYLETTGCTLNGNAVSFPNGPKVRQLSALANLWVDLPIGRVLTPYAGGGAGVAGFEIDGEGKARFSWQLGAGVHVAVSRHLGLTIDYRHRQASGATLPYDSVSGMTVGKVRTNSFGAGLRLTF